MTLHLKPHHAQQQAEVREARRVLKEKIRTDWEFETLPEWRSSGKQPSRRRRKTEDGEEEKVAGGFRIHKPELEFEPVEWRERTYSSASDNESEAPTSATSKASEKGSVYKFDAPDSVGSQLKERKLQKKWKRYTALEEEMQWNEGLEHWIRRRDEWCCARTEREIRLSSPEPGSSTSASVVSSPRTSTSSTNAALASSGSSLATTPETSIPPPSSPTLISPSEPLLPLAPPILSTHPIRRKINATMYPEIYSKIVLQSRTPSVPINLQTLVNALVQGWKDDGEWPPKPGVVEKSIGRKKGSGIVRRVLRLTGVGEGS